MSIRILVVDDNEYDRTLTARALAKLAAPLGPPDVVGVGDWRSAERYLDDGFDLMLLDYNLPPHNGLEVLAELRDRVHPPVIMMTGQSDVATAVETLRMGASDYVVKGGDAWGPSLCLAVERVVDRVRLERELADSRAQLRAYATTLEEKVETRTAVLRAQAAEIESLYLRVQESARLKAEIVANVSHELRTPLNAIFGYTDLLGEYVSGEPAEMLDSVRTQAQRLHQLVESLLALGRLKTGAEGIAISQFDLVELIEDLKIQAQILNADRGLVLTWVAPAAPCPLAHDRDKIRAIAYHLVNNAIKFTPVGRVEVTWAVGPDRRVALTVRDTGIGFPDEARALIFEDFRQLDGSTTRRYEGTGLGLGIVRRCTDLLRGSITVDSAPGRGTVICVTLPPPVAAAAVAPPSC
jgi:signal transduction histidine kinase